MGKNVLLILTACINPNGMSHTILQNVDIRKEEYIQSLNFYLKVTDNKILFVENSNNDISNYFKDAIDAGRLEIITFSGNNYDKNLGKGYGEISILQYASKKSLLFGNSTHFIKITGRYKILNIKKIIDYYTNATFQIMVDLRYTLSYSDSRCWGANKAFLQILFSYKDSVNDSTGFHFEHALCKAVHQAIINGNDYSFLNFYPQYSGVLASTNLKYNNSSWFFLKQNLKRVFLIYLLKNV